MPLTQNEINQISDAIAVKLKEGHTCRFTEDEASIVHGFRRAMKEHQAGEKEIFIVIQLGKNITEFIEGLSKKVIWFIIGGALCVICGMASNWKFWIMK